jgi:rfaE bifunctional protein kinase chain/domain
MQGTRFRGITERYPGLRIAVVGDFCLDRYLEIDPTRQEVSLETRLPVHNVVNVRPQAGGAGTILNNLAALGIGTIYPVGFAGEDGEGFELKRALAQLPGVRLDFFLETSARRTFTYCKPLVVAPHTSPVELNRLDSKNWTPTPESVQQRLVRQLQEVSRIVDAVILLDQVDVPDTGVVTSKLLTAVAEQIRLQPDMRILADSRRGLSGFPRVDYKMNTRELSVLTDSPDDQPLNEIRAITAALARKNGRMVFVTLAERGLLGADAQGKVDYVPALPVRGQIDIVGAGDAVSANLTASLAAGASLLEALEIANAAASVVIHKLGTTGTASVAEVAPLVEQRAG